MFGWRRLRQRLAGQSPRPNRSGNGRGNGVDQRGGALGCVRGSRYGRPERHRGNDHDRTPVGDRQAVASRLRSRSGYQCERRRAMTLRRIVGRVGILAAVLLAAWVAPANADDGAALTVYALTFGPGEHPFLKFGPVSY